MSLARPPLHTHLLIKYPHNLTQNTTQPLLPSVDEATALFEGVLALDPSNGEAAANRKGSVMLKGNMNADLANKLFREGKIDHALATYNAIDLSVANDDLRFQVKNNVGAIHMQRGQVSEALAAFDAALEVKPLSVDTIHNKATALKGVGKLSEALEAFDQCISAQPDFYSALCGRCEVLAALGRFQESVEQAEVAIKCKVRKTFVKHKLPVI